MVRTQTVRRHAEPSSLLTTASFKVREGLGPGTGCAAQPDRRGLERGRWDRHDPLPVPRLHLSGPKSW